MRKVGAVVALIVCSAVSAAAQPAAFGVSERPAIGLVAGESENKAVLGEATSGYWAGSAEVPLSMTRRLRIEAGESRFAFYRPPDRTPLGHVEPAEEAEPFRLLQLNVSLLRVARRRPHLASFAGGGIGVYRFAFVETPLSHPDRGGIFGVAGMEWLFGDGRWAVSPEGRVHAMIGVEHAGVDAGTMLGVDATIEVKLRL